MSGTVADLLRARSADDRVGLRAADDAWTWRALTGECAERAGWMAGIASRGPGSRPLHVGVLLDNVPEMVFLLGGAALSGNVIVALNTTRAAEELAGDATRADCDLLVTEPRHAALAERVAARTGLPVTGPERAAPLGEPAPVAPETLLMLIFTSGTSGRPRAVRVTHRKIVVPGAVLAGRLLRPDDVVYCPMPLFHSGAVMAAYAPALAAGAQLVLRARFSASGTLPDVRRYGCTYLHYVGKALSYVLATPERADDADNPLRVAFGNEAAPLEQRRFAERFGCAVVDGYGSTETAIALTPDPDGPPGALGRLGDGIEILDRATGRKCPPARLDAAGRVLNGEEAIGELVNTRGLGLFDGYYNERADDRLRDGMFWSGDLAYRDADGFVFFAGRDADRLRVDGENFGAAQVERVLGELPGVAALAVYGVPDVAAGDQVMVALVGSFDPERFAAFLRGRADLSPKWTPRYVRVAGRLPSTASNKVVRRALAADAWNTTDPVWWRPGRELRYRRLTGEDAERLRAEFESRGRAHLWPAGNGRAAGNVT
ncbi:AMP-binding protein [Actinoallomurus rhizosphaericola]|uniref:AMP-binding protein n=1 Tax=Actinoallomurus rhizosphaericola TaxID=2952536 RepID=UPI002091BB23|nr:AMP-binding protein [Actinoallomurus rhizosphaericola]MCO5991840.1 AMP-binding protein [Actinoallomurus rhizosphaericola]